MMHLFYVFHHVIGSGTYHTVASFVGNPALYIVILHYYMPESSREDAIPKGNQPVAFAKDPFGGIVTLKPSMSNGESERSHPLWDTIWRELPYPYIWFAQTSFLYKLISILTTSLSQI